MNSLWGWAGSGQQVNEDVGADAVERLCDRIATSTLLEDRRDAVRALKDLAKDYQLEVGTQGMSLVMQVLQNDISDVDIVRFALEALTAMFKTAPHEGKQPDDQDIGVAFTEEFVKHREYVSLLLSLLEEYDFYVRFHTVQALTMLVSNRKTRLQECVLADPRGVCRLMDLLDDSREIIRNEALLLLVQLTDSNAAVQKLVAFENAFDRLLDIAHDEGNSEGGIVVQDCLHLIHNLLNRNISNQNFFRETSGIKRLIPFILGTPVKPMPQLTIPGQEDTPIDGPESWSDQKCTNLLMLLELVRTLVVPGSPSTLANQMALLKQGTLDALLKTTLNDTKLPPKIRVWIRIACSEAISGCPTSQAVFMGMTGLDGARPRPVLVAMVINMLAYRNPFDYRCASLYCLEALGNKNPDAQQFMVSTLNQPPNANLMQATDTPLAAGAQLLAALQDTSDAISHWFACLTIANQIRGNPKAKDALLTTQIHSDHGPVLLLDTVITAFGCCGVQQARIWCADLVLLSTLCMEYPPAIGAYLANEDTLTFLIQQAQLQPVPGPLAIIPGLAALLLGICMQWTDGRSKQHTRASLLHVIHHVIGTDRFVDNINHFLSHETFVRAQQISLAVGRKADEVYLDRPFTVLARRARDDIMATVTMPQQEALLTSNTPLEQAPVDPETQVIEYKKLIREQDEELRKLRKQIVDMQSAPPAIPQSQPDLKSLKAERTALKAQLENMQANLLQLQSEQDDLLVLLAEQDTARK
eukprot:Ihof_evm3s13 gene=Ihof_evmTU3s13